MTTTSAAKMISLAPPNRPQQLHAPQRPGTKETDAQKAEKLHATFTQFVGQTFYGQMIKSMRDTVGHAAYFNGGQAEKIFQGQLDQTLADQMTKATADRFAEPLYQRQFPNMASPGAKTSAHPQASSLANLNQLARR
jgi:Rod binding domain-containing protein